ncbi:MAG TPA: hypothetical protein VJJ26_00275 [Candidatus Babeliales bacterium]|nr:hypothetical protein [Candidatus Babeliales bacterium]
MKKVLVLFLMASAVQGSLLAGNDGSLYDVLAMWLGGYPNLEKHFKNSETTRTCIDASKPWNRLYSAFTINNRSDCLACDDLNAEIFHFQQNFLEEVCIKKSMSKDEFCSKYFNDNRLKHEHKISAVFDPVNLKSDCRVKQELNAYQNALKEATKDL